MSNKNQKNIKDNDDDANKKKKSYLDVTRKKGGKA